MPIFIANDEYNFVFDPTLDTSVRLGVNVNNFSTAVSGGIFDNIVVTTRASATVTYSGSNNMKIVGGFGGANSLKTSSGSDTIESKNTSSRLSKYDTLTGGGGNDTYKLRSIFAKVIELDNGGIDTVITGIKAGQTYLLPNFVENGQIAGPNLPPPGNLGNLRGNALDNTLIGNNGNNDIRGGDGADIIFGRAGADFILGGNGVDILNGGEGNDVLQGGNDNDIIYGAKDDDELYGDSGADTLFGGDGLDILRGGAQNDVLDGGDGDDILIGTASTGNNREQDVLTGGSGADDFVLGQGNVAATGSYYRGNGGFATITDFSTGDQFRIAGSASDYTVQVIDADTSQILLGSTLISIVDHTLGVNLDQAVFAAAAIENSAISGIN